MMWNAVDSNDLLECVPLIFYSNAYITPTRVEEETIELYKALQTMIIQRKCAKAIIDYIFCLLSFFFKSP